MSKRILSLVLALTLVLGSFSMAFAAPADVVGTPIESAVDRLGDLGILSGYTDGTFKPENKITRAEFASIVVRARGLEAAALASKGNNKFADVPASHWASGYVAVAQETGLVAGMGKVNGKDTFAPEANITYEQAVTMVVRSLGYTPAAVENGGYPIGFLVVASQEGLLDGIQANNGELATRGLVAQLVDNALEVPKMIQVGYGDQKKFVKSGTEGTKAQYLFNDLQLSSLEGIVETNSDKKTITVTETKDNKTVVKTLKVTSKDFDYAGLNGLKVQVWHNTKDEVISVKALNADTVKYDAVKISSDKKSLTTVTEDKKYDIDSKAVIKINGKVADLSVTDYPFAKVVLNDYGDVAWLEINEVTEQILVSEVKGNDIVGYGKELADANKYTIMKDGKQVALSSLKDKDLVLYNSTTKFAVVASKVVKADIERVYSTSFKFEGKNYDNDGINYVSGKTLEGVNKDVLDEMKANGKVNVYFNFKNQPVLIDGEVKEVVSNYVMVIENPKFFTTRGTDYTTFDYMNAEGKIVKNEIKVTKNAIDVNNSIVDEDIAETRTTKISDLPKAGEVAKVGLDSKGNLSKIESVKVSATVASTDNVKLDAAYAKGYKLNSNTTVFWNKDGSATTKHEKYEVASLADAKKTFNKVEAGKIFVDNNGNIVSIVATKTDIDADTVTLTGIVKDVRTTTSEKYVLLEVNGVEKEYRGSKDKIALTSDDVNKVANIDVTEDGIVKSGALVTGVQKATVTLKQNAEQGSIVITNNNEKLIVEGKYYERQSNGELKVVTASNFKQDDVVDVYYRSGSTKFVQVVVKGAAPGPVGTQGVVTYVNATDGRFAIGSDVYKVNGDTKLFDANGNIQQIGATLVLTDINNAKVTDINVDSNGFVTSLRLVGLDNKLSEIKWNGTDVGAFAGSTLTYNETVPFSLKKVPTVTAKAVEKGAKVEITQATKLVGTAAERTATIKVTPEDGSAAKTYTVVFTQTAASNVVTASSVKVAGVTKTGTGSSFNVVLPYGSNLADVVASDVIVTSTNVATLATPVTADNGVTWTVGITAEDGTTTGTITINMSVATIDPASVVTPATKGGVSQNTPETITVVLKDTAGNAITGLKAVDFVVAESIGSGTATISSVTEVGTSGVYTFTVSNDTAEAMTYTITVKGTALTVTPVITTI